MSRMMGNTAYVRMKSSVCDGDPASSKPLPMWAELAAQRQGKKASEDLEARFGRPVLLIVRTHWHHDGSVCAHVGDRCFKITRKRISERRAG